MPVDAKTKYKAKKTKIVFFDIDDTLRVKKTGYIPESIKAVFKGLKEKGILTGIATGRGYYGVVEDKLFNTLKIGSRGICLVKEACLNWTRIDRCHIDPFISQL